jgi:hypothetical protein
MRSSTKKTKNGCLRDMVDKTRKIEIPKKTFVKEKLSNSLPGAY